MKKISQIETGGRFLYGGVEWVKLYAGDGTVAISAEPVFERAFDEDNKNDWRSSSLRRELNGAFLDALVAEGADRSAFASAARTRRRPGRRRGPARVFLYRASPFVLY